MSAALQALELGVDEVDHLLSTDPTPKGGLSPAPQATRAVIRAAVVILSSHFERYVRAVTEEAVTVINQQGVDAGRLTEALRLQHSRIAVDQLIERVWEQRATRLSEFIVSEGWLWSDAQRADLDARRLLTWMKSPMPLQLLRVFGLWGIDDIFARITRKSHTRGRLFYRLTELVEKRNNIAHGEFRVDATRSDIEAYQDAVRVFCRRADAALARALKQRLGIMDAWKNP